MTDSHKLFMVKINKMIKKKTGGIFLVIYVIYGSLLYIDSKETVSCLLLRLPASCHLIMQTCTHTGWFMSLTFRIGLYLSVLSNLIINLYNNQDNFIV